MDASGPYAFGKLGASLVRGSKFRGYPDAAHGLLVTHAEGVSQDILEFLAS